MGVCLVQVNFTIIKMKRYRFSSGDEETSRRAEQQFLRITENMTDEQRDAVLECLIKMQKHFLTFIK